MLRHATTPSSISFKQAMLRKRPTLSGRGDHINACQQEAMAKEREFNEARQQWVAQRSEAEQKYERLKLI